MKASQSHPVTQCWSTFSLAFWEASEIAWEGRPLEGGLWSAWSDGHSQKAVEGTFLKGLFVHFVNCDSIGHFFSNKHLKKMADPWDPGEGSLLRRTVKLHVHIWCVHTAVQDGHDWDLEWMELQVHRMTRRSDVPSLQWGGECWLPWVLLTLVSNINLVT